MGDPDSTDTTELRGEKGLRSHASRMWRYTAKFWKTRSFWVYVGLIALLFLWEMDYVHEGKLYAITRLAFEHATKHPFIVFALGGLAWSFLRPKFGYFDEKRR